MSVESVLGKSGERGRTGTVTPVVSLIGRRLVWDITLILSSFTPICFRRNSPGVSGIPELAHSSKLPSKARLG